MTARSAPSTPDQDLEDLLWRNFMLVNDWLWFAEAKNAVILVFAATGLAAVTTAMGVSSGLPTYVRPFLPPIAISLSTSAIIALSSFSPILGSARVPSGAKPTSLNPLFFGHIAHMDAEALVTVFRDRIGQRAEASPSQLALDTADQIVVNSRIGLAKLRAFEWSAYALLTGFLLLATPFIYRAIETIGAKVIG
jgi:hypothetical protein